MRRRKSTEEILFESLYDLMKTIPFTSITVQQIVDNCGKTKPTFYNHFRDKYELLSRSLFKWWACLSAYNDTIDWYATAIKITESVQSDLSFFKNAFGYEGQNSLVEAVAKETHRFYLNWIERLYEPGDIGFEDISFAIEFFSLGVSAQLCEWVQRGAKEAPEAMARKLELCIPPILRKYFYIKSTPPSSH